MSNHSSGFAVDLRGDADDAVSLAYILRDLSRRARRDETGPGEVRLPCGCVVDDLDGDGVLARHVEHVACPRA